MSDNAGNASSLKDDDMTTAATKQATPPPPPPPRRVSGFSAPVITPAPPDFSSYLSEHIPGSASRRTPGQYGAGDHFVMQIPTNKVGMVIGKGGETIKSMQAKSGARIQVIPLTLEIDGTSEQIECAKQLISEVISEVIGTLYKNVDGNSGILIVSDTKMTDKDKKAVEFDYYKTHEINGLIISGIGSRGPCLQAKEMIKIVTMIPLSCSIKDMMEILRLMHQHYTVYHPDFNKPVPIGEADPSNFELLVGGRHKAEGLFLIALRPDPFLRGTSIAETGNRCCMGSGKDEALKLLDLNEDMSDYDTSIDMAESAAIRAMAFDECCGGMLVASMVNVDGSIGHKILLTQEAAEYKCQMWTDMIE